MSHLHADALVPAFNVEPLVRLGAIQDGLRHVNFIPHTTKTTDLVTPDLLGNRVQSVDDAQAELLAPLVLCDRNVLDMPDEAEIVYAFRPSARRPSQSPA